MRRLAGLIDAIHIETGKDIYFSETTRDPKREEIREQQLAVMADARDSSRPSFSEFWKKSKETLGVGRIRFVESTAPGQGEASGGEFVSIPVFCSFPFLVPDPVVFSANTAGGDSCW